MHRRSSVNRPGARRAAALVVLAGSQLLIVLDATIVNVALSAIARDLRLSAADLQWVITGYVLAFGGFLLLGGRLADTYGRRRLFVGGATLFAIGSVACALAWSAPSLLVGRAVQGLGAAAVAPSAMSLLLTVFPEGDGRAKALAVWGGVSSSGTALGLILGGVITDLLSWEWVFALAAPIAGAAAIAALRVLPETAAAPRRFDVAGAALATGGLTALVYGLVQGPEVGWRSTSTVVTLLVAAILVGGFAWTQTHRSFGLLPRRLLRHRAVVGANVVGLILGAAIYGLFFFMSLFMGDLAGYDAVETGLAFLPMAAAIAVGSAVAGRLIGRTGPFSLLVGSTGAVTVGLASLARISPATTYLAVQLPGFLLTGVGLGLAFVALTTAAVGAAPPEDRGVAAALFNSAQQVGGALGLALMTAVSTARTAALTEPGAIPAAGATTAGWSLGFAVSSALMASGLIVILVMVRPAPRKSGAEELADASPA